MKHLTIVNIGGVYNVTGAGDDGRQVTIEVTADIAAAIHTLEAAGDAQKSQELLDAEQAVQEAQEAVQEAESELSIYKSYIAEWGIGEAYQEGQIVRYEDALYSVVQSHTSQDDWQPDTVPALYTILNKTSVGGDAVISEWVQPTGAHDAYNVGDKVTYEGKTWESTVDGNAYAPGVVDGQWVVVDEP